jgi:dolichyl-phosphate-mannose--protein O-mannosyl transferase
VAPAVVYAASYAPLVAVEPGLGLFSWAGWRVAFVDAQLRIYEFHANLREIHADQSAWWTWPLMVRPTWYAFAWDPGHVRVVWAIGNAVIWWASLPALLATAAAGRTKPAYAFVALLGLGPWLAWGLQPRTLTFMQYYLPAIPFACLALAAIGQAAWRGRSLAGGTATLEPVAARVAGLTYVAAACAWFAFYYPMLTYTPLTRDQAASRIWFERAWL